MQPQNVSPSVSRTRAVLRLLEGESAEALASELGVPVHEVESWRALYLAGARAQLDAGLRPLGPRRARVVGIIAATALLGMAGIASSQSRWPIPLIQFAADTPAVASEVNGNFTAVKAGVEQLRSWLDAKIGDATTPGVTVSSGGVNVQNGALTVQNGALTVQNGLVTMSGGDVRITGNGLQVDYPGASWDLWLQGSTGATSGSARNLALLGSTSNDRLIMNFGGEYTGGVEVQSGLTVGGATTVNGTANITGSAVIGQALTVNGLVESSNRYVVSARYDADFPAANATTSVTTIDQTRLETLCGDVDGCAITMIMRNYDVATGTAEASQGPLHFDYSTNGSNVAGASYFRVSEFNSAVAAVTRPSVEPRDGDGAAESALRVYNCLLSDAPSNPGAGSYLADSGKGLFLVNRNLENYRPDCVLVIDD
jgi:hypothetical protein